jgi:uncharacterized membrane protein
MQSKKEIISIVKEGLDTGAVACDDFDFIKNYKTDHKSTISKNLINIFYIIGGIIALLGAILLVAMFWGETGLFGRLFATLGVGLATYLTGILIRKDNYRVLSSVFIVMSSVLMPLGAFFLLDAGGIDFSAGTSFTLFLFMFLIFFSGYITSKRNIIILINSIYASITYFSFINLIGIGDEDVYRVATILLAVCFLLFTNFYLSAMKKDIFEEKREIKSISNVFYGASSAAIYITTLTYGQIADFLMIIPLFAGFYGGVYVKSRTLLASSALFTMIYIGKISVQYFENTLGWPILLILLGFVIISIGVFTHKISNQYIK